MAACGCTDDQLDYLASEVLGQPVEDALRAAVVDGLRAHSAGDQLTPDECCLVVSTVRERLKRVKADREVINRWTAEELVAGAHEAVASGDLTVIRDSMRPRATDAIRTAPQD